MYNHTHTVINALERSYIYLVLLHPLLRPSPSQPSLLPLPLSWATPFTHFRPSIHIWYPTGQLCLPLSPSMESVTLAKVSTLAPRLMRARLPSWAVAGYAQLKAPTLAPRMSGLVPDQRERDHVWEGGMEVSCFHIYLPIFTHRRVERISNSDRFPS